MLFAVDTTIAQTLQDQLTPILVDAVLAVVIGAIGFVGRAVHGWVNAQKNVKGFEFLTSVAEKAVQAAEQLYAEYDGDTKKQFALDFVKNELARRNINVDVAAIDAAIEAAVMTEFNYPSAVEPATGEGQTTDVVSTPGTEPEIDVTSPVDEPVDDVVDDTLPAEEFPGLDTAEDKA